jgi:hypothetical protein
MRNFQNSEVLVFLALAKMIVFKLSVFDGVRGRVLLVTEAVPGKLYAKPNKYIAEVPLELKLSAPH